jgi:hypothetical protein
MGRSEMYHVGIVVPDLEAAQEHFGALLDVEWGPVLVNDIEVRDGDGNDLVMPNKICYSTGAPYLELIQEMPGTVWVCNDFSNLHHIGYFSTDLVENADGFASVQCPLELAGRREGESPVSFTYHRDPLGVRIEHVDAAMRAGMEQFLTRPPA